MPEPILYVAITNHGFGHATRTASLVATVKRLYPDVVPMFVTKAPRWLLESYLPEPFIHRPRGLDIGVIQGDSLTMDKVATLEKLRQIRQDAHRLIAAEVNFIRQNRCALVLADIPPLATAIARQAGVPCWMVSNFGWDFIYRAWGGEFEDMADWIADLFGQCDRLFRLPFHESMTAFPTVTDVGLIGGSPADDADQLRAEFHLTAPQERTVLLTFGGLGIDQIPYDNLKDFPDWQFITFDRQAPDLPNLVKVGASHYRPVDFMPLCHQVVSKPGYSTFAEACRVGIPICTVTREDFAEAAILVAGIRNHAYHRIVEPAQFFSSNWDFLRQPFQPPLMAQPLDTQGNEAIAQAIVDYLKAC
jgi:hypothetical protein